MLRISPHLITFLKSFPKTKEFCYGLFAVILGVIIAAALFVREGESLLVFAVFGAFTTVYLMVILVVVGYKFYGGKPAHLPSKETSIYYRTSLIREIVGLVPLFLGAAVGIYFLVIGLLNYASGTFVIAMILWFIIRHVAGKWFVVKD